MIKNLLLIGAGGAAGSILRYLVGFYFQSNLLSKFPWPTFMINVVGSFLIGIFIAFFSKNEALGIEWKYFFVIGFCGGFTTFSAFSIESLQLIDAGYLQIAIYYIAGSVLCGLAAVWLGFRLIA